MDAPGAKGTDPTINVTPLVDVVLVLLIVFMVATPNDRSSLDAELPHAVQIEATQVPKEQMVVQIDEDGAIKLNGKPITQPELVQILKMTSASDQGQLVFFDVHDSANYGYAIGIMDACRGAGIKTMGLKTANP